MEDKNLSSLEEQKDSLSLEEQVPPASRTPGGWKTMKYIIGNETFEKLASMSLISNITLYLRVKYNMDGIVLVNVVNIWFGTSNIAPLVGAFLSDTYLGRYRTLILGSFCSLTGMAMVTLTAAIHPLRPPNCGEQSNCPQPHSWQLGFLFLALGFLSMGAGGIRPCNIAFGADQFDAATEKGRSQLESFFNWYYFSFTIALLVVLTVVVYIQTNISWVIGFAIPTAFLALSIFVFLLGSRIYIYVKPRGSVFVDIVKVIVASWRKKHIKLGPVSTYTMYDPPLNESGPGISKLAHTNRFSYVDKAAVITDSDELDTEGVPKDNWRLCSVQQVEQLKCLISIIPVWLSGIACVLVMDQHSTFGILQAIQTNRFIGHHFKVPPGWMSIVGMLMLTIWILFYERIFIPLARRITKKDTRITLRQRIRGGIIVSILCMVVAGSTERKRRTSALKNGSFTSPLPIAILLPQFMLSGLAEALASVAIMEFLTLQMPQSLRTIAGSIFFLSLGISSYLSSFIVNIVEKVTKKEDGSSWLGGRDLNKNRLDNYYYIIAAVGAVNLIYFTFFAARYITSSNASSDEQHVETLIPMNPTEQEHQERFGADENKKREH